VTFIFIFDFVFTHKKQEKKYGFLLRDLAAAADIIDRSFFLVISQIHSAPFFTNERFN